jgi:methylated-DNA-[protein]-cysteine S-methyltransferase
VRLYLDRIPSPVGTIVLVSDDAAVRALDFADYEARMHRLLQTHYGAFDLHERREQLGVRERLAAYFGGDFAAFEGLALATNGTPFQKAVWAALCAIAPGTTATYGALARGLGLPSGARAVGLANGANPISLIVPCHRVIGADGTLTGYAGGLHRKHWLLRHEGVRVAAHRAAAQAAFDFSAGR